MKVLNKFNLVFLLVILHGSLWANVTKLNHEQSKEIVEEFDVNTNSNVLFDHRRGTLHVKYIEGNTARVKATVTVKGEDLNDIQSILEAMTIDIEKFGGDVELTTVNNIKSWSSSSFLFTTKHEIIMKDGRKITTKVEQISIAATLYLPKVNKVVLKNKYDDILVEGCKAEQLEVNIHSAKFKATNIEAPTYVKVRYGKLDLRKMKNLTLESHDSKGTIGDVGELIIKDKYSDFVFGNALSLDAELHDSNLKMGSIAGAANIFDKYSVIDLADVQNGKWNLHDSKISIGKGGHLTITTKYTDVIIKAANKIDVDSHDDDFRIGLVDTLHVAHSKYSEYDVFELKKAIYVDDSHDDDFDVTQVNPSLTRVELHGKYTDLQLPLPINTNYGLEANMKYGDIKFPKEGLKETTHIRQDSDLKLSGIPANGSADLKIVIVGHDCQINLN